MRTNINEDSRIGFNDVAKAAIIGTIGVGLGGAAGTALGGSLGLGSTATGMLSGGLGGLTTGALNGDITAEGVISGALIGGLNPGGMLSDSLGLVPNNFAGGFVQGGTNGLLSGAIQNGELDWQSALASGLIRGGMNSAVDFFQDASQNSIQGQIERIQAAHRYDYIQKNGSLDGYTPLSVEAAYQQALTLPNVGTSDLGGLIGEDGLLPFIPAAPVQGFNNLTDSVFGYAGGTPIFTDADGNQMTEIQLLEAGYSPQEVWDATQAGQTIDGYSYLGVIDSTPSQFDELVDKIFEGTGLNTVIDGAALAQFESRYGFDPRENPELARLVISYGELDERYSWADNPRGDSEYYGIMSGLPDEYTTGATWGYTGPGVDDAGNPLNQIGDVLVLNTPPPSSGSSSPGSSFAPDGAGQTLPGADANYTLVDAYINGLLTGSDRNADTNTDSILDDELPGMVSGDQRASETLPSSEYYDELPMVSAALGMLPSSGGGEGGGEDGGGRRSGSRTQEDPEWGPLYRYMKVEKWQRAREKLYSDMTKGMLS